MAKPKVPGDQKLFERVCYMLKLKVTKFQLPTPNGLCAVLKKKQLGGGKFGPPSKMGLSPFTKLWQSCSNPHLKIRPIAIFAFCSLSYSLAARLQDNSRPKSPTKVETKRKLQQFTVSGWLIINGGASDSEKRKL